jgi:hypothetical protein
MSCAGTTRRQVAGRRRQQRRRWVRYRLFKHPPVRPGRLGPTAAAAVRRRHADYFVTLAETAGPHLRSRGQLSGSGRCRGHRQLPCRLRLGGRDTERRPAFRLIAPFTVSTAIGDVAKDWAEIASDIPVVRITHFPYPVVAAWASQGATLDGDVELAERRAVARAGAAGLGVRLAAIVELDRSRSTGASPSGSCFMAKVGGARPGVGDTSARNGAPDNRVCAHA